MKHILSSGLVAGLAAGLLCALLQFLLVEPHILLAEKYETGEITHFQGASEDSSSEGHSHGTGVAAASGQGADTGWAARQTLTVLFSVLTYAGYGLLLASGMILARQALSARIGSAAAMLWGLAGFLAFQFLPALGLEPNLPGTPSADLYARQVWWAATAGLSVGGLGLLGFGRGVAPKLAGLVLIVLPQAYGAPALDGYFGSAPPELAAAFATRSLAVGMATWVVLGLVVQRLLGDEVQ